MDEMDPPEVDEEEMDPPPEMDELHPPEMDEQEDPPARLMPYLLVNRREAGRFEIIWLVGGVRRVITSLPNNYDFLSSNGLWGMMAGFEPLKDTFMVMLFSFGWQQGISIPVYVTVDEQKLHPRPWAGCIGTFSGLTGEPYGNDYQIYLLEPPTVGGGGTIWTSYFRNTLGQGDVLHTGPDTMNVENLFADEQNEEICWERVELNGEFNGAFGMIYQSHILYWVTTLGVDSYDLHSRVHSHYALHPDLHFLNDYHGLGPRIYLASRDSDIFYISLANQLAVQIGKLVNGRVEPFDGRIEDGTVLVNRGQAGIWIEDLSLLHPCLHNKRDTISEGPPVPWDLATYYFRNNIWVERTTCDLLECQGIWLLSADDRLRELRYEPLELDLHIYDVPGIGELPPAAEAEEGEEDEDEEEDGAVIDQGTPRIGTPHDAHEDFVPQLAKIRDGNGTVMVPQFIVEFQGLKAVDGEEPPKVLHLNPRLKGDWSEKPILKHNTCYRMSWGKAMFCDGLPSRDTDETGDGFQKCESWVQRGVTGDSDELKTTSWLNRFIGRAKKPKMAWPFSFSEGRMFVLTIQAGVEGYHINIGGRHISSFPYRTGFTLEDATGLAIKGDFDVHSVFATSLPQTLPSFSPQQVLEMTDKWRARPLLKEPAQLFVGILSATNHFAERMAIRKTWMQYPAIQLGHAVARFCVALSPRKGVNAAMKKEAEYFGDIVILPFLDRYDLVVLKTFAICEYGVQDITSDYIMKCDDDTFVRVDVVLKEMSIMGQNKPIYTGNLNLLHRPLRSGKWAVTYEEWPEELYPPYANGPGYIVSFVIPKYIVSQQTDHKLRLFKMEDESMGMWVKQFDSNWFQSSTCTAGNLVHTVVSKTTTK